MQRKESSRNNRGSECRQLLRGARRTTVGEINWVKVTLIVNQNR